MYAKGFLTFAAVLLAFASATTASDLAKLCNGQLKSINRISQAKALIVESKSSTGCDEAKLPLAQLEPILEAVEAGRMCTLEFVEMVRRYKADFIRSGGPAPAALRLFFSSLCFQVSVECKKLLLSRLEADTKNKVTGDDFELFESTNEATGGPEDFDDIIMPSDIRSAFGNKEKRLRMLVNPTLGEKMGKTIELCAAKFRPFYSKLILPLIELSHLGYNYQGERLESELAALKTNKLAHKWFNVVQTCETFPTSDICVDKANVVSDKKSMVFVGGKEADKLRRSQGTLNDLVGSVEPLVYEPQVENNLDELWIQDEDELKKQIATYKASHEKSRHARTSRSF